MAVNPAPVALCRDLLEGSGVRVSAAVSFPLGANTVEQKVAETRLALADGAQEIDYVVNISALRDDDTAMIEDEMRQILAACRQVGALCKVTFETCFLTSIEKRVLAAIARDVRPDFVRTSTGRGPGGATYADVKLLRHVLRGMVPIKAAGGIRTADEALRFAKLGVTRLGSSVSASLVHAFGQRFDQERRRSA